MKKTFIIITVLLLAVALPVAAGVDNIQNLMSSDSIDILFSGQEDFVISEDDDVNIIGYTNYEWNNNTLKDILLKYIVEPGDSLYNISLEYGVTVEELKNINKLQNNIIYPEQELLIPAGEAEFAGEIVYYVQPGDSLYKIAQDFETTIDALRRRNDVSGDFLYIGQRLIIPPSETEEEEIEEDARLIYFVEPGDSLYRIAEIFDTSTEEIREVNELDSTYLIPGQMLYIPGDVEEPSVIYFVNAGDSLYKIAQQFDSEIDIIREANDLYSDILNIGQTLQIPVPEFRGSEINLTLEYEVESGDTFAGLSERYNVPLWVIKQYNEGNIGAGEIITIPFSVSENELNREKIEGIEFEDDAFELLTRAVYSEARGEPFAGQVAVASVIINRILHNQFPDTAREVIFQPWQFEVVDDGQFWLEPNQQARLAVEAALGGWDSGQGAIYFYNPDTAESEWIFHREVIVEIGDHYFALTV